MVTLLGFFGVLARLLRPTRGAHTTAFGYLRELGFFGVLARLLRPTRGAHTTAFGYLRELGFEARRNRSRRVRRYVKALMPPELTGPKPIEPAPLVPVAPAAPARRTPVASTPPAPASVVPAPRRPIEDILVEAFPQVEIVRGPYRAWESHRAALKGLAA